MVPIVMEQNYQEWIRQFVDNKKESVISIDGKCIRGAGNKDEHGAGYAHMLSAYLSEEGISPGQLNVDKKTNEITVFPK